ncbi:low molecular weight protein-tyrosine-phosphatase [Nitratireductor thuwali]|uniref:protein-tyrosine-phosphatase n=1 Tax=Nitratireductor thuwali TaxID=2267699 RepID=A0ABY5MKY3_9HYPH|nr:Low molecular weight protein-tyrosine-phosphatase YfkJ [Nitratireductor thuwali]
MNEQAQTAILFVCLGNICRSPLAEGIFRAVAAERGMAGAFHLDSAGTGAWHVGSPPDPRSVAIAAAYGIDISAQRARKVGLADFERFDLILGMDNSNVRNLRRMAPEHTHHRIHLFSNIAGKGQRDVPDPYYGGEDGFSEVYLMIREASAALIAKLAAREGSAWRSGHASSMI